jgi:uncharacterized protein (DUF1810 family)
VNADDFVAAQNGVWPAVLAELRAGRKTSHWMWFVFPQLAGLGRSPMSRRYAVLGPRLREVSELLLDHTGLTAFDIFGGIDAMKLRSSMTLFADATGDPLFQQVLDALDKGDSPL